jgi:hypothetical protein
MARKKSEKPHPLFQTVDPNISLAVLIVGILAIIFALYLVSRPSPVQDIQLFDTSVDQSSLEQAPVVDEDESMTDVDDADASDYEEEVLDTDEGN